MFGRFSCWSPPPVRPQYDPLEELQQDPLRSLNGPGVTLLACQDINLHDLPALRQRGPNYYWGPWCRSCIFVCLAVGLAAEHDRVRLCLVVVFAFIFESVGLPTMASQNYDSPFLDMVVLPVVWIAAFAAVSASITIPQQTSSLFHRKLLQLQHTNAYDGCRFSRWSPSYSATQERFAEVKLPAIQFLTVPEH